MLADNSDDVSNFRPTPAAMQQFRSIHYLRGIAAVMVVVFHICTTFPSLDPGLKNTVWLQSGVDIFFIISGFVMVESTKSKRKDSASFLFDRAIRIIPIYWIVTLCYAVFYSQAHVGMILPSLFFIPVHHPETGALISAVIPPGWTLNLEVFFYVVFAVLIKLSYKIKLLGILLIFTGIMAANSISSSKSFAFYANPIIIEFWLGMLLARYYHLGRWWMLPVGVSLLFLSKTTFGISFPMFAPGAFLVVAGTLSIEKNIRGSSALRLLGDSSYVLYLVHVLMIAVAHAVFGGLLQQAPLFFIFATALLSIATALLVNRFIEKPMIKSLKNWASARSGDSGQRPSVHPAIP